MPIIKTRRPYEFLVRWAASAIAGAHVQFLDEVSEDGVVLSSRVGDALPVSMAGEAGFPLTDILAQMHADAMATTSARIGDAQVANARAFAAEAARDAALSEATQVRGQLSLAQAEIARLRAVLEAKAKE